MEEKFKPKTRIELDPVGLYYALINRKEYTSTHSISAHLKEDINPKVLQEAVNDLIYHLPFLNVSLKKDFFSYYHEILEEPLIIQKTSDFPGPCTHFEKENESMIRVLYNKQYFTIEAMHSICDGRGLTKIMTALLIHYFELLDLITDESEIFSKSEESSSKSGESSSYSEESSSYSEESSSYSEESSSYSEESSSYSEESSSYSEEIFNSSRKPSSYLDNCGHEEAEDAYNRFADLKQANLQNKKNAYHPKNPQTPNFYAITQKFDLSKIKAASSSFGATVNEYILAHIFMAIACEREVDNSRKPITAFIPVDCRNFFHSKTLRNFLIGTTVSMPETNDFSKMLTLLRTEFDKVNEDFVIRELSMAQKVRKNGRHLPLILKKLPIKLIEYFYNREITTTFSNLGFLKLPSEIDRKVEMLEFTSGREPYTPYTFTCIAHDNTLTLTTNLSIEDDSIAKKVIKSLNEDINMGK